MVPLEEVPLDEEVPPDEELPLEEEEEGEGEGSHPHLNLGHPPLRAATVHTRVLYGGRGGGGASPHPGNQLA